MFFFFQAEDGIRDVAVTGVQTCALPICRVLAEERRDELTPDPEREVGSERVLVGDAANPVGAEQACHRAAPSRRRPPIGSSDLISTVTCTLRWSVRYTDSGSASPTLCDTVSRRPAISTGTVSTVVRPSIVERGPLTCTVAGSAGHPWIARSGPRAPPVLGHPLTGFSAPAARVPRR